MLTIVIPAFNEERRIKYTLHELQSYFKNSKTRVLVVCQGTDSTFNIVKAHSKKWKAINVIKINSIGKGAALQTAILQSNGNIIFYDADAAYPPSEVKKIEKALKKNDLTLAYRKPNAYKKASRITAHALCKFLVNLLFNLKIKDSQAGLKGLNSKLVSKLKEVKWKTKGYEWDVELIYKAKKLGCKIKQVEVNVRRVENGKAKWTDAFGIAASLIHLRFNRHV